ncbi:MAG TPA: hypothetical protein VFC83_04485 [Erysipelotrichaceae bacterium]|nr:hypothetical protein [Erysipelotrichaceae bacterium]
MQYIFYIIGVIVSGILLFVDKTYSFAILLALLVLFILDILRSKFNKWVLSSSNIKPVWFVGYTVGVFVLMFSALGIAFLLPEWINPYFFAGVIFIQRIYMFIEKSIRSSKEELSV